jgi:hypothetical protein
LIRINEIPAALIISSLTYIKHLMSGALFLSPPLYNGSRSRENANKLKASARRGAGNAGTRNLVESPPMHGVEVSMIVRKDWGDENVASIDCR